MSSLEIAQSATLASTPMRRRRRRNKASESLSIDFHELYTLEDVLGRGAYAVVRTATDRRTGKKYAVKIVDRHNERNSREKCMNEMRMLKACAASQKIVKLCDFKEDQDNFYMVFELLEGGSLQDALDNSEDEHFKQNEAACVIRDLAQALSFLHNKGMVHRDLKPDNILCLASDFASPCKVTDFDLAFDLCQDSSRNRSTMSEYNDCGNNFDSGIDPSSPPPTCGSWVDGHESPVRRGPNDLPIMDMTSPVGSPEYMAPEIVDLMYELEDEGYILSQNCYNQGCDIWSLGVIAYRMLSGRAPFVAITADCKKQDECEWNYGGECKFCQYSLLDEILTAELRFPKNQGWSGICEEAIDLVRKCLDRNMHSRISASEILEHPFIKRYAFREMDSVESTSNMSSTKRNIEATNHAVIPPMAKKQQVSESPCAQVVSRVKASDTIDDEDMKLLHELTNAKLKIGGGTNNHATAFSQNHKSNFSLPVPIQQEILLEENGDSGFAPDSFSMSYAGYSPPSMGRSQPIPIKAPTGSVPIPIEMPAKPQYHAHMNQQGPLQFVPPQPNGMGLMGAAAPPMCTAIPRGAGVGHPNQPSPFQRGPPPSIYRSDIHQQPPPIFTIN